MIQQGRLSSPSDIYDDIKLCQARKLIVLEYNVSRLETSPFLAQFYSSNAAIAEILNGSALRNLEFFRWSTHDRLLSCRDLPQVTVAEHDEATLRQMLEYIYTNRVKDMPGLSADEVIKLLALADGE